MAQEEYESRSKGQKVIGKAVEFVKRETVLFVAALLAWRVFRAAAFSAACRPVHVYRAA